MDHAPDRPAYRPSGRIDLVRLPAALALLVAGSAGIVALYTAMIRFGLYLAPWTAFFPLMVGIGVGQAVVKRSHCRNRVVAGALAAACGLTGFLAHFHVDQCVRWGVPWGAVDRLPDYIAFRMETDRWRLHDKAAELVPQQPAPGVRPRRLLARANVRSWNWLDFAYEALLGSLVPLAVCAAAAGEPYSEKRRRWCNREQLLLAKDHGETLKRALAEGTVDAWAASGPRKVGAHQPHCKVLAWYTRAEEGEEPDPEVYLTVGDSRAVRLAPEEAAAFVPLLPALQDLAGPSLGRLAAEADESSDPASARVWPLPPEHAGRSQNPRNRRLGRCLVWSLTLLPGPLILGVLIGGTYLLGDLAIARKLLPIWALVAGVLALGFGCIVFTRRWYLAGRPVPMELGIRFDHRLLRRAIASRPQPLVAADDPRAVFAEMQPRRLWSGGPVRCGDYNQGVLLADAGRRGILFEGDYERYWIPAASVLGCDVESMTAAGATTASLWAVVVRVRLGGGTWEFPFFPLDNIEGATNWDRAKNLLRRIEAVCGRGFADQPAAPPRDPGPVVV